MQAQPAFTAVAARQTLHQPMGNPQKTSWTPEIREYVQRAFDANSKMPGVSQHEMQEKLKTVITWAAESREISNIDWSTYALPQQLIMRDREQAALYGAARPDLTNPNSTIYPSFDGAYPSGVVLGKRKSSDFETSPSAMPDDTFPSKKLATRTGLEARISGKTKNQDKKQKKADAFRADMADGRSSEVLERRKQRFGHITPDSSTHPSRDETPSAETSSGPVVGTCQKLEKNYFRLTSAPKPEEVRPLPVLKEMMNLLRKKWKSEHNYTYACDQFKSLRQDLTVQRIQNEFTVSVYEAHARIALEMGDLGEYNQCQTQLRALYKSKLGGRPEEFTAYRILYFIYTCNRTDMNDVLADLTEADRQMDGVKHALQVRAALAAGNYHKFFRLYQETPFMGAYLLDLCVPRERLAALAAVCKSYKPDVSLGFLVDELAFQGEDDDPDFGSRSCVQFICDHGGEHLIQRKDDGEVRFLAGQARNLFDQAKSAAFRRVDIKGQI